MSLVWYGGFADGVGVGILWMLGVMWFLERRDDHDER